MTDSRLVSYAKELRNHCTDSERTLWRYLRAKRLEGFKFRRQQPIGKYIVDFVCLEKKIIIEIDGGQHTEANAEVYDRIRDSWLEGEGYRVLRFWANEILLNTEGVLGLIMEQCLDTPSPASPPLKGGEIRGIH